MTGFTDGPILQIVHLEGGGDFDFGGDGLVGRFVVPRNDSVRERYSVRER